MLRKLLPLLVVLAVALLFADCNKNRLPNEDLTNKERMNLLEISDPLVWNSLAEQSMEVDTTDSGMKSMTKEKTYPNKGYYFTIFEDLYPSQGDYDFNDVMIETTFTLDGKKGVVNGTINAELFHKGGSLPVNIGLVFYSVKGNKEYTVIDNSDIYIDDLDNPIEGEGPYILDEMPEVGVPFSIEYKITDRTNNINQLWIAWFVIKEDGTQIHTAGFPTFSNKKFEIPQTDYLTSTNLPWGLTIEAEEFYIPAEQEVFVDVYPEFAEWAESGGVKNKKWFENPDMDLIQIIE